MVIADIKIHLIGITPNISWSIDPFGHSPTMAFFNKRSGAKAMVIQRIHFGIKRHLAKIKTMEFQWRQIWGKLDIFFYTDIVKQILACIHFLRKMYNQVYLWSCRQFWWSFDSTYLLRGTLLKLCKLSTLKVVI